VKIGSRPHVDVEAGAATTEFSRSQHLCGTVQAAMMEKTMKQAILKLHETSAVPVVVVKHGHWFEE
jgi:hypothetical protein